MKKKILISALSLILLACGGGKEEGGMKTEERLEIIQQLEDEVFGENGDFNTSKMLSLVNNYSKFADENPDHEMAASYLFKAGDISMGIEKSEQAIQLFSKIIEEYPNFDKVPYCYFLKGFIYENNLNKLDEAKEAYETFIEKYPNHEMTEGARFSLKNLGKSPEDLIREFEAKQVDSTQLEG